MSKELVISAASHERRVAILEEGQLVEIYIEREKEFALVGSIYKGRVTRVLPGMQSAFVDIGLDGDAFLYVSDVFENLEDYDHGHAHTDAPAAAPALFACTLQTSSNCFPAKRWATLLPRTSMKMGTLTKRTRRSLARIIRSRIGSSRFPLSRRATRSRRRPGRCRRNSRTLTLPKCTTILITLPKSASPIRTHPLRRIFRPTTIPLRTMRRAPLAVEAIAAARISAAAVIVVVTVAATVAVVGAGAAVVDAIGGGGRPQGPDVGGRNLPPSKYASPQGGESRGNESRGYDNRSHDNRGQDNRGPRGQENRGGAAARFRTAWSRAAWL